MTCGFVCRIISQYLAKRSVYDPENTAADKYLVSQGKLEGSKTTAFANTNESQSIFLYRTEK
jgi:hypothetical protein